MWNHHGSKQLVPLSKDLFFGDGERIHSAWRCTTSEWHQIQAAFVGMACGRHHLLGTEPAFSHDAFRASFGNWNRFQLCLSLPCSTCTSFPRMANRILSFRFYPWLLLAHRRDIFILWQLHEQPRRRTGNDLLFFYMAAAVICIWLSRRSRFWTI